MVRRGLLAFAIMTGWLGCSEPEPATQLVVAINADAKVAAQLVSIRAFTYDVAQTDESKPSGEHVFTIAKGAPLDGQVSIPFSFGITKKDQDRLRVVIKGYTAADPAAPPVIEQKVITAFQAKQRLAIKLFLPDACLGKAAECTGLQQTCVLAAQTQARCMETPPVLGAPVAPGDELAVVPSGDAAVTGDAPTQDAATQEPEKKDGAVLTDRDAGTADDASVPPAPGAPIKLRIVRARISADGSEFASVTHDRAGNIYAAGKTVLGSGPSADSAFVVARYSQEGELDTSFGRGGYAIQNVTVGGRTAELAQAVVIQADGKIVLAGEVEHATYAADAGAIADDTDLALVRLQVDGALDTSFGNAGVVRYDLGTGVVRNVLPAPLSFSMIANEDRVWSMKQTADGRLVIHARTTAATSNEETDFVLLRLHADGQLDASFGVAGIVRTDFDHTDAVTREALVLPSGSIVGTGVVSSTLLSGTSESTIQPVLYRVGPDGAPDALFATQDPVTTPGVFHDYCRLGRQDVNLHGAALQGSRIVTLGTSASSGNNFDWVFFRFNEDGTQDKAFGLVSATSLDPGTYADEGRALITLPDNRLLGVGMGRRRPETPPAQGSIPPADGMIAVLAENGVPDSSFGPGGFRLYDFGGYHDELYDVALSPDKRSVAAVGETQSEDDWDAVLLVLPTP